MSNPPLIPWDEVAEGPVWFRAVGLSDLWWQYGTRYADCVVSSCGLRVPPADIPHYEFTAAEQQPGQHAAEIEALKAELARWQVCGNCGEKLEGPGHCGSAVTEHEKGLERMLDETLTRAEKAEEALALLHLDYDILRGGKKT